MLLIDSGNSAIKCRRIELNSSSDLYFSIFKNPDLKPFTDYLRSVTTDHIYLASVSDPGLTQKISDLIIETGIPFSVLETQAELDGINNGYKNYRQLGVDRWLTVVGAGSISKSDTVIIDAGTAITIDLLSASQGYLGGAILPGFNTEVERFKKIFPDIDFNDSRLYETGLPGRTTEDCINASVPITTKTLDEILTGWQHLLDRSVNVLLCGKDASIINGKLQCDHQVISGLVFKGMLKQIQLQG